MTDTDTAPGLRHAVRCVFLVIIAGGLIWAMHASENIIPDKGVMDGPSKGESLGVAEVPVPEDKQVVHAGIEKKPEKTVQVPKKVSSEKPEKEKPAEKVAKPEKPAPEKKPQPVSSPVVKSVDETDWSDTEITGPIRGAYIVIYPKRKFIGLVKGKKYIRKYYNIAVPEKLEEEKETAEDGRCPYGNYFIAGRKSSDTEQRIIVSYPSAADAGKALSSGRIEKSVAAKITAAAKKRILPPQGTALGGGISITADRADVTVTRGGFAMEREQFEELYLATRKGTWVIIRK